MEQVQRTSLEQVQEEAEKPEIDLSVKRGRSDIEGAQELQSELGALADSFNVRGFKCVHQDCGLVHGHDTTKHRGSDSFDMSEDEAAQMEFNPNCHCGLNELARKGHSDAPSPSRANEMAPIPDSATRSMERQF